MKTTAGDKRRKRLGAMAAALLCALVASLAVVAGPAAAEETGEELPTYVGLMTFAPIRSAAAPEEYSWRVRLSEGQRLTQVDATDVEVEYASGLQAVLITAEKAADAEGKSVPTTLAVTGEDVITLTVHHRAGNPAAGGAPFDYPINPGEGWEGGFQTEVVKGPPDETELRQMREAEEAAQRGAAAPTSPTPALACDVPSLRGLDLRAAKARLRAADCGIGKVHLARGATEGKGRVVKQFHAAGIELADGAPVAVKLGAR